MTHNGGGDGRHIDESLGALTGEGAGQRTGSDEPKGLQAYDVWSGIPTRTEDPTYYDRPVVKEPVWIWAVPTYFFVGGTAGAAAVLAEVAESLSDGELDDLVRRARWVGAIGGACGTALLIYDLGRPERFLNMLRVFRPSSAMSMGSWIVATAAPAFAGSAILPHTGGLVGSFGNAIGKVAGVMGLPLAGYTAALLGNTAVPAWQAARKSMPFLFVASGTTSAASLLGMMTFSDREERVVRRFGIAGGLAETAAALAFEKEVKSVEQVGKPLEAGASGALWKAAKTCSTVSLAASLVPGDIPLKRFLAGVTGTAAGLLTRFAVFEAGVASARDPRATFRQQRAGRGGAESTGSAAVTGSGGRRAAVKARTGAGAWISLERQQVKAAAPRQLCFEVVSSAGKLLEKRSDTERVYEFTTPYGGREIRTVELLTLDAPRAIHYRWLEGPLEAVEETISFEESGGATAIIYEGRISLGWNPVRYVYGRRKVKPAYDRIVTEHLAGAKDIAEKRAARSHLHGRPSS